eukprot:gene9443-1685_t
MSSVLLRRCLLISNSTSHPTGYLDHCAQNITDFLHESQVKSVLFIPFALHNHEEYATKARNRFQLLGFELTSLHEYEDKIDAVRKAESIFVGGGNTFRLLDKLYQFDLLQTIQSRILEGAPYIGTSAGSNVACRTIRTTNDMPIVQPPSFDALNLVPIQINPHYLDADLSSTHKGETRRERLEQYLEENTTPVLAIPEGTMLKVEGNTLTLHGMDIPIRVFIRGQEMRTHTTGDDISYLLSVTPDTNE